MRIGSLFILVALVVVGCGSGDLSTPSPEEQLQIQAQYDRVFAGIDAPEADRAGVRAVHQLAYWAHTYHEVAHHYPLDDRLGNDRDYVQVFVFGDDTLSDPTKDENIAPETFLAELREVLGDNVVLPSDPVANDFKGLYYSTNGMSFMAACDLSTPVNGGEMATPDYGQYTVASYAIGAILHGEITSLPPAVWRIPSMAESK
jgi:hypothetical protein